MWWLSYSSRFSPSWREAWHHGDRHGAGKIAKGPTSDRQQEIDCLSHLAKLEKKELKAGPHSDTLPADGTVCLPASRPGLKAHLIQSPPTRTLFLQLATALDSVIHYEFMGRGIFKLSQ